MMIAPFIQGFGAGGGLIVAIGAQNAFVLSQGVRGNHHVTIAFICILCDAIFITAGVAGIGGSVSANPILAQWVAWGGAGFLFVYGCGSLRSAVKGGSLETSDRTVLSLSAAILTTLAVTLLNPHFYLDTVILWVASAAGFMAKIACCSGPGLSLLRHCGLSVSALADKCLHQSLGNKYHGDSRHVGLGHHVDNCGVINRGRDA